MKEEQITERRKTIISCAVRLQKKKAFFNKMKEEQRRQNEERQ